MSVSSALSESSVHASLHEAVPILDDSITSRVLIDNEVIRAVHFSFDAGQGLTEHTSPRAVVCQVTEGSMAFTVDGSESTLETGDVVYLAPSVPHSLTALSPCRLTLTMVDVATQGAAGA